MFKIVLLREGATRMMCQEAGCEQYERGWLTVLNESDPEHAAAAHAIRTEYGRRYVEFRSENAGEHLDGEAPNMPPGLTVFKFYAGQQCFRGHADREVLFIKQRRGARPVVEPVPLYWNEAFNEEAQRAVELAERS